MGTYISIFSDHRDTPNYSSRAGIRALERAAQEKEKQMKHEKRAVKYAARAAEYAERLAIALIKTSNLPGLPLKMRNGRL